MSERVRAVRGRSLVQRKLLYSLHARGMLLQEVKIIVNQTGTSRQEAATNESRKREKSVVEETEGMLRSRAAAGGLTRGEDLWFH